MDSWKCQTSTVTPAEPGGFPLFAKAQLMVIGGNALFLRYFHGI